MLIKSDKEQPKLRVNLPHEYSVLGWFHVTDLWPERAPVHSIKDGVTIFPMFWKFRLERIDLEERCWMEVEQDLTPQRFVPGQYQAPSHVCPTCGNESKQIFSNFDGWTCLESNCVDHFRFFERPNADLRLLTYNTSFVNQRTAFPGPAPGPLVSGMTAVTQDDSENFGTELAFRSGGVCPVCRCCAGRKHWDRYSCENPVCGYQCRIPLRAAPLSIILEENAKFRRHGANNTCHKRLKNKFEGTVGGYQYRQWLVPGPNNTVCGSITILRCEDKTRQAENGPNDLWGKIQEEDHNLSRNAVRHAGRECI